MRSKKKSFTRIITPILILLIGILLVKFQLEIFTNINNIRTIGLALFTVGSFGFIVIINDSKNPFITQKILINLSQSLVVYGGLIVALFHTGIFGINTSIITVGVLLIAGTVIAVTLEYLDLTN